MFEIQYRLLGEYKTFSYKETIRSAKREAKNLSYYSGYLFIRIKKPDETYIQICGEEE